MNHRNFRRDRPTTLLVTSGSYLPHVKVNMSKIGSHSVMTDLPTYFDDVIVDDA